MHGLYLCDNLLRPYEDPNAVARCAPAVPALLFLSASPSLQFSDSKMMEDTEMLTEEVWRHKQLYDSSTAKFLQKLQSALLKVQFFYRVSMNGWHWLCT